MGEVYRARDSRLNRDVAIKVLAPHMADDTTALLRFEREGQALAALSHPGIVGIFDVGRHEESAYVVMEFLEGETLRSRLAAGPIGIRKSLDYSVQIAYALAAAHERGIVHRDLKPENVFLCADGRLKILDFGIVSLVSASAAVSADTIVPTPRATAPHMTIGTVGYMAPEQARGQIVDARADIFALGAVLYEMLSGHRAFDGDTTVDVLANVLHGEPPDLHPDLRVPSTLDRIVRRCLEKRSEERFQSARDLAFALEGVASGSGTARAARDAAPRRVPWWAPAAAALIALAIGLGLGRLWRPAEAPAAPSPGAARFVFDAMRGQVPEVSISPNGRHIAWTEVMRGGRLSGLMVRRLDSEQPRLLTDTPATGPFFWSPDGREIVFVGDKSLVALDVDRGGRRVLTDFDPAALPLRGGDWVGQTLVMGMSGAIWTQDLSGRQPRRQVTKVNKPREAYHGWPALLPDQERFFYMVMLAEGGTETRIGSLTDADYVVKVALPPTTSRVRPDDRGYLVFGQNRVLMAQRLDFETGAIVGSGVRLAPEVFHYPDTGWVAADVSRNSVLVWRSPGVDDAQFEWVDRGGRTIGVIGDADAYTNFDVSPDGARIVTVRRRGDTATTLFLMDKARNLTTPISSQELSAPVSDPTWSPDGQQIAYRRGTSIVARNVFGGDERVLRQWTGYPDSWSSDNKYLLVGRPRGPDYQLWAVAMDGTDKDDIQLVSQLPLADEPRFSPDRKWVAFHAALQGAPQVFAIRFPPTGERWQLSADGGVQPRWGAGGRELYYLDSNGQVMVVAMPNGDPTKAGSPRPLFGLRLEPSTAFDQFAPVLDGQSFLIRRPRRPGGADTGPVHVVVNWPETLPPPTDAR